METKLAFEAIRSLLSKSGTVSSCSATDEALTKRLESNIASYRAVLQYSRFKEISKLLEIHKAKAESRSLSSSIQDSTLSLYNDFTSEALALVAFLEDHLCSLDEEDKRNATMNKPSQPPPAPSAMLSVADSKTFRSLLEFVVSLGVYPYLLPGIDGGLRLRLSSVASITKAGGLPQEVVTALLYDCCSVFVKCFGNEVIGPGMLNQHLPDVLAALIQVCYAPTQSHCMSTSIQSIVSRATQKTELCLSKDIASPAEIVCAGSGLYSQSLKETCAEMLQGLLNKTYQPLVVKELLVLQGMASSAGVRSRGGEVSGKGGDKGKGGAGGGARGEVGDNAGSRSGDGAGADSTVRGGGKGSSSRGGAGSGSSGMSVKWLRRTCGELLSERLMSRNGVQHVINGIMEVTAGMY